MKWCKMKNITLVVLSIMLLTFICYGCKDTIVESEEVGKINFQGGTIESIKTDDDTTAVLKLLGKPDWIGLGDIDGFSFCYEAKLLPGHEELIVFFVNKNYGKKPGDYRVTSISVMNGYSGKSKEGIGIGSTKADVVKAIGLPSAVYEYGENYLFERNDKKTNYVIITYDENLKVRGIVMDTRTN